MRTITMIPIFCLLAMISPMRFAAGDSTHIVDQKISLPEVLQFLGIHAWKLRIVGPVQGISASVVQYVRGADGQFHEKSRFGEMTFKSTEKMNNAVVSVMLQEQGDSDRFGVAVQGNSFEQGQFPKSLLADYNKYGDGSGGSGLRIGTEHILMAKYINIHIATQKKKDMSAYVALVISSPK